MKIAYLNWACVGRPREDVFDIEDEFIRIQRSYPHDPKNSYKHLQNAVDESRESIAELVNYQEKDSFILTTGVSHSLQLLFSQSMFDKGTHVVTTDVEFSSIYALLRSQRFNIEAVPILRAVSNEQILNEFSQKLKSTTKIVFFSHVSYLSGAVFPIEQICALVREKSPAAMIIIDGAQAVGQIPVNLSSLDVDAYVFGTNKWLTGTDIGVMIAKNNALRSELFQDVVSPFSVHGSQRDSKMARSGVNAPAVAALKVALQPFLPSKNVIEFRGQILQKRKLFIQIIKTNLPDSKIIGKDLTPSGIISLDVTHIEDEKVQLLWSKWLNEGLYAYYLKKPEYNHDILDEFRVFRFSIHSFNSDEEIRRGSEYICKTLFEIMSMEEVSI